MPDITMCSNKECKLSRGCYRSPDSGTTPDRYQSWAEFDPGPGLGSSCEWLIKKDKIGHKEERSEPHEVT